MIPERDALLLRHVKDLHEAAMDATLPPARRRLGRMAARTRADEAKSEIDKLLGGPTRLPEGPTSLDFEILPGEAGGEAERERRARWIEHVKAHASEIAAIAVERTRGEPFHERATLAAPLLARAAPRTPARLDRAPLAAPLGAPGRVSRDGSAPGRARGGRVARAQAARPPPRRRSPRARRTPARLERGSRRAVVARHAVYGAPSACYASKGVDARTPGSGT